MYKDAYVVLYYAGKFFIEMVRYLFTQPDVKLFLSQRICQDPLERFFGCQWQCGGVHDCSEFMKNTQALRVINELQAPKRGNCRGGDMDNCKENWCTPLPKRRDLNSLGSIAPIGVRITRTFGVQNAKWRLGNICGYLSSFALLSCHRVQRFSALRCLLPFYYSLEVKGQGARGVSSLEARRREKAAVRAAAYAEEGLVRLRVVDTHNGPL